MEWHEKKMCVINDLLLITLPIQGINCSKNLYLILEFH